MTPKSTEPTQAPSGERSRPSRRGTLDRKQVLAAAVALVDAEGLEALTMRRLGQELNRDPMTLYRYVPNRSALLDGVAEHVLDELEISIDGSEWQTELRRTAHDFRALALAHPHIVPLLVTRPPMTPLGLRPLGTLRPLERILELLASAGFPPADSLHVYRTYFGFLFGSVLNEMQEIGMDPEEAEDLLRLGLHRLPAEKFPYLRGLAGDLVHFDGAAELDYGLNAVLIGLEAQLDGHTRLSRSESSGA